MEIKPFTGSWITPPKILVTSLKTTPDNMEFGFCVYGDLTEKEEEWVKYWNLETSIKGPYTNIILPDHFNLNHTMYADTEYKYVDGFSPNLNKHLHIGHFSNLVIAKALQNLGIGEEYISILGDTIDGEVLKYEAYDKFVQHCDAFGYNVNHTFLASDMKLKKEDLYLFDGLGKYKGSKVFLGTGTCQIVGIKKTGQTSYFYQDVSLIHKLIEMGGDDPSILYLVGNEQTDHFKALKSYFRTYEKIDHLPLGLVSIKGEKMSTRKGNVILLDDVINMLLPKLNNDLFLVWNVMAGQILKTGASKNKSIDLDTLTDPKKSQGMYLSYTMARMNSAGVEHIHHPEFIRKDLQYKDLKSKQLLAPNILFEGLVDLCKKINSLYKTTRIEGNPNAQYEFSLLYADLLLGVHKLGLFPMKKV